jgi:excisionase family DNA binding protein
MAEVLDGTVWLTSPEAQEYLKVSKATLYNLMKDGRLPFYYIKGTRQRRIKQSDLDALLELGNPDDLESSDDENQS